VSIVPAAYYAHHVAARARCYRPGGIAGSDVSSGIESATVNDFKEVKDNIKKTMFFT
jgi:hypothetical protein